MGRFQKGQSGNPAGRPKGRRNKTTEGLRNKVIDLIDDNYEQIKIDLAQLQPKERIRFWVDLLRYILPEQVETSVNQEITFTQEEIERIEGEIYLEKSKYYTHEEPNM